MAEDEVANLCMVCGDKGSGFHYAVYTCEGCKGFFKRTVQKCLAYTCKDQASCEINRFTRNTCQFCRFQKCLSVGMKREGVREDHTPGGTHRFKRFHIRNTQEQTQEKRKLSEDRVLVTPTATRNRPVPNSQSARLPYEQQPQKRDLQLYPSEQRQLELQAQPIIPEQQCQQQSAQRQQQQEQQSQQQQSQAQQPLPEQLAAQKQKPALQLPQEQRHRQQSVLRHIQHSLQQHPQQDDASSQEQQTLMKLEDQEQDNQAQVPRDQCLLSDDVLMRKLISAKPDIVPVYSPPANIPEGKKCLDVNDFMKCGYMELRYVINWAKQIPGFQNLIIEDQMCLLKAAFMELNVLRLAFRSMGCAKNTVKFATGLELTKDETLHLGWGGDLVHNTLEFIERLKEVNLNHTEFCIMNAVVLTYPDAPSLQAKNAVTNLQCIMLDILRKYVVNSSPHDPRRYGKILLRLPTLRTLSLKATENFLSMTVAGNIKMDALVLEILS